MGQDPGTSGTAITADAQPEQLREQIEETRRELGDTVEALAAKTDVKAQAKRKLEETKSSVAAKKDELVGKARSASPGSASGAAAQISEQARAHPARAAAAGAFLAGFLTGRVTKR